MQTKIPSWIAATISTMKKLRCRLRGSAARSIAADCDPPI
jgi:hypothetical protein